MWYGRDVRFIFRPLDGGRWPSDGETVYKPCRFRAKYMDTLELLKKELRALGVNVAIIESELREGQIRVSDSLPKSKCSPSGPKVRLSFTHPDNSIGDLSYPCDTFDNWKDNLRAIAKTLEASRTMDRYGATRDNNQYRGWKRLPGAIQVAMTVEAAAGVLVEESGTARKGESPYERAVERLLQSGAETSYYYREAAKCCHPDTEGGSQPKFIRVQEAKRILEQHHERVVPA